MILVIDANIVIAALIRNSKVREILLSGKFKFLAPDFVKEETFKYLEYVRQKSGIEKKDLDLLVALVFQEIQTIPKRDYESELKKAEELMNEDIKDAQYVACYLALKCDGVWTNDSDFNDKEGIKVFSTAYLVKLL